MNEVTSLLDSATHILIGAGAGWSVASGLPTYRGSSFYNESYKDVCRPLWGESEEDREKVFKPFWEECVKLYGGAEPHPMYEKLLRLVSNKNWYVYTSNVDALFLKSGFERERVCEIHGNYTQWQCMDPNTCPGGRGPEAIFKLQKTDNNFINDCKNENCTNKARPNIMMFGDDSCVVTPYMGSKYQKWEDEMEIEMNSPTTSLLVIEFGCGKTVPAIRSELEVVVSDINKASPKSAVLVRVNNNEDDCTLDCDDENIKFIPLTMKCDEFIDQLLEHHMKMRPSN